MKRPTSGIKRSKFKVTRHRTMLQKSLSARYLNKCSTNFNKSWQAHIMVGANCVTTTWMQKVKRQRHTRPQIDLEAWRRHHCQPIWTKKLFQFSALFRIFMDEFVVNIQYIHTCMLTACIRLYILSQSQQQIRRNSVRPHLLKLNCVGAECNTRRCVIPLVGYDPLVCATC